MPIFLIVFKHAIENVTFRGLQSTQACNNFVFESAFEFDVIWGCDNSLSISIAFDKFTFKNYTIFPCVLALSMRLSLNIASLIAIAIRERFFTKAMLKEIDKLPLIFLSGFHCMDSVACNLPIFPLPHITLSFKGFPISTAIFLTIFPLP